METVNPMPKDEAEPLTDTASAQLRADLRTLAADLETLKADMTALGRNQVDRVKANVVGMDQSVGDQLSEKPFRTLAITFAAGYLFAAITR